MSRLPKIITKQVEESIRELKQNLLITKFPSQTRQGLYDLALEEIEKWESGEIDISTIYVDKKHPVMIARYFFDVDKAKLDYETRKKRSEDTLQKRLKEKGDEPTI